MKYKSIMALVCGATMMACNSAEKKADAEKDAPIIGKSTIKVENGIMTPEALYSFGRLSDIQVSPDKSKMTPCCCLVWSRKVPLASKLRI